MADTGFDLRNTREHCQRCFRLRATQDNQEAYDGDDLCWAPSWAECADDQRDEEIARLRARVGILEARCVDLSEAADPKLWSDNVDLCDAIRRTAYDMGLRYPGTVDEMVACLMEAAAKYGDLKKKTEDVDA